MSPRLILPLESVSVVKTGAGLTTVKADPVKLTSSNAKYSVEQYAKLKI